MRGKGERKEVDKEEETFLPYDESFVVDDIATKTMDKDLLQTNNSDNSESSMGARGAPTPPINSSDSGSNMRARGEPTPPIGWWPIKDNKGMIGKEVRGEKEVEKGEEEEDEAALLYKRQSEAPLMMEGWPPLTTGVTGFADPKPNYGNFGYQLPPIGRNSRPPFIPFPPPTGNKIKISSSVPDVDVTMEDFTHDFARYLLGDRLIVVDGRNGAMPPPSHVNKNGYLAVVSNLNAEQSDISSVLPPGILALRFEDCREMELSDGAFAFAKYLRLLDLSGCSVKKLCQVPFAI